MSTQATTTSEQVQQPVTDNTLNNQAVVPSSSDDEKDAHPVDLSHVEAPLTLKAYCMCGFAAFGGMMFGYDSGYISGVLGMDYVITMLTGLTDTTASNFVVTSWKKSLITCILSLGTFLGALVAGDLADWYGRRTVVISGCVIYTIGVILQVASHGLALLCVGRTVAGIGVGLVSATIIMYMSEIAPRKIRGAIVSGYQFFVTIGLLLAACVDYGTEHRTDSGCYRIPIGIQFLWGLILGVGLFFLPESPRFYIKKGRPEKATEVLARLRGQPVDSPYIKDELAEIIANNEIEEAAMPTGGYFASWGATISGSLRNPNSNVRRTILGTSLQMMQQWTGVNFIFYYGTTFFQQIGTIHNSFLTQIILNLINAVVTPISFYTIERFGRRPLMVYGAVSMFICEFIVAIVGTAKPDSSSAASAMVAFMAVYVASFATTWGPGAWVIVGEIFPIPIRSRGVALSTASNWFWNCIIAVVTPYMCDSDEGNLGAKVYFVWGALCVLCFIYAYFLIFETKGLTLEQVDLMMAETTPKESSKWKPHETFTSMLEQGKTPAKEAPVASHDEGSLA